MSGAALEHYPQGSKFSGPQISGQTNLELGWPSSMVAEIELKGLVAKLSEEVNRLEHMINDMGERMNVYFSMNEELFHDFTVVLRPDNNNTFVAYVPAISGCHAWGRTPQEAQAELVNVFEMIKEEYEEEGKPLPKDITSKAAHACQS